MKCPCLTAMLYFVLWMKSFNEMPMSHGHVILCAVDQEHKLLPENNGSRWPQHLLDESMVPVLEKQLLVATPGNPSISLLEGSLFASVLALVISYHSP